MPPPVYNPHDEACVSAEQRATSLLAGLKSVIDNTMGDSGHNLFAYPLESNFTGARYDVSLVTALEDYTRSRKALAGSVDGSSYVENNAPTVVPSEQRWWVLLDAAKGCSTSPPDLSLHKPHFVVRTFPQISHLEFDSA